MKLAIASYSYHRLLAEGKQDIYGYITECKRVGATQLDPWNGTLALLRARDAAVNAAADLTGAPLTADEEAYLGQVSAAADTAGLPFGCVAVDGAHIYDASADIRRGNRAVAYRWLAVAQRLGASQVRIDAGGTAELPDEMLAIIRDGYRDVIDRAARAGLQVLIENHWGPSPVPESLARILEAAPGLGLLFDTNNWAPGRQLDGWRMFAGRASSTHFKPWGFDEQGRDPSVDLELAARLLLEAGYNGCWGVESAPKDGDEIGAVEKTIALLHRVLAGSYAA